VFEDPRFQDKQHVEDRLHPAGNISSADFFYRRIVTTTTTTIIIIIIIIIIIRHTGGPDYRGTTVPVFAF
jgi:hypothetical protein